MRTLARSSSILGREAHARPGGTSRRPALFPACTMRSRDVTHESPGGNTLLACSSSWGHGPGFASWWSSRVGFGLTAPRTALFAADPGATDLVAVLAPPCRLLRHAFRAEDRRPPRDGGAVARSLRHSGRRPSP
jgi:hypothetical protein